MPSPGSVLLALQRATHATLHHLAAERATLDLAPSDLHALARLRDGRVRTVSELGVEVGTKPTTLSGVLDRLERRGLVTRAVRPGNRRSVLVALTEDGAAAAEAVCAAIGEVEVRALTGLTDKQIAGFFAVVRALTEPGPADAARPQAVGSADHTENRESRKSRESRRGGIPAGNRPPRPRDRRSPSQVPAPPGESPGGTEP